MVSIFPRKNGKPRIHELSFPNHIIAEILLGQHLAELWIANQHDRGCQPTILGVIDQQPWDYMNS